MHRYIYICSSASSNNFDEDFCDERELDIRKYSSSRLKKSFYDGQVTGEK